MGFVDIHEHLLYGIDDGPAKKQDMYRMLDAAAGQGISAIVATPHVIPGIYDFDKTRYEMALAEARDYCSKKLPELKIYGGAEIMYTPHTTRMLKEGRIPTMAGTDVVLIEFSPHIRFGDMREALGDIVSRGYRPLLAHVERYQCLRMQTQRAGRLKREYEAMFQLNCSPVLGEYGLLRRVSSEIMLCMRLIDALASDSHGILARPNRLAEARNVIADRHGSEYADWLVSGNVFIH